MTNLFIHNLPKVSLHNKPINDGWLPGDSRWLEANSQHYLIYLVNGTIFRDSHWFTTIIIHWVLIIWQVFRKNSIAQMGKSLSVYIIGHLKLLNEVKMCNTEDNHHHSKCSKWTGSKRLVHTPSPTLLCPFLEKMVALRRSKPSMAHHTWVMADMGSTTITEHLNWILYAQPGILESKVLECWEAIRKYTCCWLAT